jgi:hypothetical protein
MDNKTGSEMTSIHTRVFKMPQVALLVIVNAITCTRLIFSIVRFYSSSQNISLASISAPPKPKHSLRDHSLATNLQARILKVSLPPSFPRTPPSSNMQKLNQNSHPQMYKLKKRPPDHPPLNTPRRQIARKHAITPWQCPGPQKNAPLPEDSSKTPTKF